MEQKKFNEDSALLKTVKGAESTGLTKDQEAEAYKTQCDEFTTYSSEAASLSLRKLTKALEELMTPDAASRLVVELSYEGKLKLQDHADRMKWVFDDLTKKGYKPSWTFDDDGCCDGPYWGTSGVTNGFFLDNSVKEEEVKFLCEDYGLCYQSYNPSELGDVADMWLVTYPNSRVYC